MHPRILILAVCFTVAVGAMAGAGSPLRQTGLLTNKGDLSAEMVAGIDRWLMRETTNISATREKAFQHGFTAEQAAQKRAKLREIIGAVGEIVANGRLEVIAPDTSKNEIFRAPGERPYSVFDVRWQVLDGLWAEGLLLEPLNAEGKIAKPVACVIALPDADQTPEALAGLIAGVPAESQWPRHLAQSGWRVLVPVMISREDTYSGSERLKRFTNQPHREWIYRQAYEMGRHVIGHEVAKVLAAAKLMGSQPLAVGGYGEGGLIALHAAALEPQIKATLVSGYFGPREHMWQEPIYRNVFSYLREFSDAELAALAPGKLIIEHSAPPKVQGPPPARQGRSGAAPGAIAPPEFADVEAEVDRANVMLSRSGRKVEFVHGSEGMAVGFGSVKALTKLAAALDVPQEIQFDHSPRRPPADAEFGTSARQERAVRGMESHTQQLFRESEDVRAARVWRHMAKTNEFLHLAETNRDYFWREVIGKIEHPALPPNPRSRQIYDKPFWTGYEVMLDVYSDVFAWGYLLVPKDLKEGERRPVVVCQHGLEGLPEDTVTDEPDSSGFRYYQAFAARLAERGFVVYAPHNPYRGKDRFRVLQRKANPLGLSLFSFIIAQHAVTTDWLASLPFVDAGRIGFYGLSYGGKTAMRVPAILNRYCLSICSADFNEWVQKNVTTDAAYSYMFTGEYEMPEWNLGHTFNYAEMASLIYPRPFMVERGHDDGVAPDTWVAYEYAKVQRMYNKLGHPDRARIEYFNGPHQIHGVGTFDFLHHHLNWPAKQ